MADLRIKLEALSASFEAEIRAAARAAEKRKARSWNPRVWLRDWLDKPTAAEAQTPQQDTEVLAIFRRAEAAGVTVTRLLELDASSESADCTSAVQWLTPAEVRALEGLAPDAPTSPAGTAPTPRSSLLSRAPLSAASRLWRRLVPRIGAKRSAMHPDSGDSQ